MSTSARKSTLAARLAAQWVDKSPEWSSFALTSLLGKAARVPLPAAFSKALVSGYSQLFGVDLSDVDPSALDQGYRTFDDFFTRSLLPEARPVTQDPKVLVSPCDGYLRESSIIEKHSKVRAKGHAFDLESLLGDEAWARDFIGGRQTTIYLHPRDYHRVHVPLSGRIRGATLIPGRLMPVTDAALELRPELFSRNERLIHRIDTPWGSLAVVMVAAFGVSHMSCAYARLDPHPQNIDRVRLEPPREVHKGAELGVFHLGSTVILLSERGFGLFAGREPGPIRMGQPLLQVEAS